jgi:hypothetical protein
MHGLFNVIISILLVGRTISDINMMRRSRKRCSPSHRSEVKHGENRTANSSKGKRRKFETNEEMNDSKSAKNIKDASIHNDIQPEVEPSDSSSDEFMYTPELSSFSLDRFPRKKELTSSDFTAIENNILTGVMRLSESADSDFESVSERNPLYSPPVNHEENVTATAKIGRKKKTVNSDKYKKKFKNDNTSKVSTGNFNMVDDGIKDSLSPDVNKMDVSQLLAVGESLGTNHEENITTTTTKIGRKNKTVSSDKYKLKLRQGNTSKASTGNLDMSDDGMKDSLSSDINKMDVSQLLAVGENLGTISKGSTGVRDRSYNSASDSENNLSDWEEVKGLDVKPTEHIIPKEGIEVTLEMPDLYRKCKKRRFDLEAHLRRRLNRMKREFQVLIHKVHLLCWIAHGRYVNSVLNSEILMAQALSLIPSQHCYPAKHTNLSYLEKILEWFKKTVTVADRIETNASLLPLPNSLQQSFQSRTAHSTRDLVFMFICILRALGVKTRLILSLQPLPLKPSTEDLCGMKKTKKSKELGSEEGMGMKVEKNDTEDTCEASTSKKSLKEQEKFSKDAESESVAKLQDEKQRDDKHKKVNKKSRNSNLKSKAQAVKKPRNDLDIPEEKMQKLRRTLRARKETGNMYREKPDSSDEDDISNQDMSVACKEEQHPRIRIASGRHRNRPAADVSRTGQQKTLLKVKGSERKSTEINAKRKRNLSQIASSLKEDESSDSDFIPESKSFTFKMTELGDSSSETESVSKKVMQKKATNKKVVDKEALVSDSGKSTDKKGAQKKKKNCCDVWSEVFLEEEEKWISVDVQSGKFHCIAELHVSEPISAFAKHVAQYMILN